MISWGKSFEVAFKHRAGIAESAYKKLRLVWNSTMSKKRKLYIFRTTFMPSLIYGLDSLTLLAKHFKRIDAYYCRFLRRVVGIKASYYSRIPNTAVREKAGFPSKPSDSLYAAEHKLLRQVFLAPTTDPMHHVVLSPAYKDRIQATGRCRGGKIPYWIEVITKRYYSEIWDHNPGRGILGPNQVYSSISRALRSSSGYAPMRAGSTRARP